jgi:predicted kinase
MPGHRFYTSSQWRKFRKYIIDKNGGICNRCATIFTDTSKLEVHHISYLREEDYKNPTKTLSEDNVEVVCHQCHNEEHGRFVKDQEVILVFGPPLSGKTSFVRSIKNNNDIVVDLDKLQEAITLNDPYRKADAIKYNLFELRNTLYDNIAKRYGKWKRAFIVATLAASYERDTLINRLNVDEVIMMETSKEECIARLDSVNDLRHEYYDEWLGYINKWFSSYTPPSNSDIK